MKTLILIALLVSAPTVALAIDSRGTGHTDCDYIRNDPARPDCLGYNPFHADAARYAAISRRAGPVYFDPYGLTSNRPAGYYRSPGW